MKQPHTPRWHKYYALVGCLLLMVHTSCNSQLCADGDEDDKSTQPTSIRPRSFRQKIFLNRTLSGSFHEENKTLIDFVRNYYGPANKLNSEASLVVLKILMDNPAAKVKVQDSLREDPSASTAKLINDLVNHGSNYKDDMSDNSEELYDASEASDEESSGDEDEESSGDEDEESSEDEDEESSEDENEESSKYENEESSEDENEESSEDEDGSGLQGAPKLMNILSKM